MREILPRKYYQQNFLDLTYCWAFLNILEWNLVSRLPSDSPNEMERPRPWLAFAIDFQPKIALSEYIGRKHSRITLYLCSGCDSTKGWIGFFRFTWACSRDRTKKREFQQIQNGSNTFRTWRACLYTWIKTFTSDWFSSFMKNTLNLENERMTWEENHFRFYANLFHHFFPFSIFLLPLIHPIRLGIKMCNKCENKILVWRRRSKDIVGAKNSNNSQACGSWKAWKKNWSSQKRRKRKEKK